jgi:hypothetical protein
MCSVAGRFETERRGQPGLEAHGRPSNNRLPEAYRDLALSLARERYADFGPTLAAVAQLHGCTISLGTLRGWMIAAGLWIDRRHHLPLPASAAPPARLLGLRTAPRNAHCSRLSTTLGGRTEIIECRFRGDKT